jgi:hypothetical protein
MDRPSGGDAMKTKQMFCLLLLGTAPALAGAGAPVAQISDLAQMTGLSERQVQMVVGAHTAYAEYLTQYDSSRRRFIKALGTERYEDLMAGREIVLDNGQRFALARD